MGSLRWQCWKRAARGDLIDLCGFWKNVRLLCTCVMMCAGLTPNIIVNILTTMSWEGRHILRQTNPCTMVATTTARTPNPPHTTRNTSKHHDTRTHHTPHPHPARKLARTEAELDLVQTDAWEAQAPGQSRGHCHHHHHLASPSRALNLKVAARRAAPFEFPPSPPSKSNR